MDTKWNYFEGSDLSKRMSATLDYVTLSLLVAVRTWSALRRSTIVSCPWTPPQKKMDGILDTVAWGLTGDGSFSISSAYEVMLDPSLRSNNGLFKKNLELDGTGVGSCNTLEAELYAILLGANMVAVRGLKRVAIENDSLLAVRLIREGCSSLHPKLIMLCFACAPWS